MYEIYLHIKQDTGAPFYVGYGSSSRSYDYQKRSDEWKLIRSESGVDVIILDTAADKDIALDIESYWINRIGRLSNGTGPLINKSKHGSGTWERDAKWKQHLREYNIDIGKQPPSQKDTIWINNGIENKRIDSINLIPAGYIMGRVDNNIKLKPSTCTHCGFTGAGGSMKRWHHDNCKQRSNHGRK